MAWASVVFPVPRSPERATRSGARAACPKASPHARSSASLNVRRPRSASGGSSGWWNSTRSALRAAAGRRAAARPLAVLARPQLEQLVAQPRGRLEVQRGGRLLHLRLEPRDELRQVGLVVARRRLGHAAASAAALRRALLLLSARIGDAGDEAHLVRALRDAARRDAVRLVVRALQVP